MANVGSLVVDLRANSAAFVAEMEKSRTATERLSRNVEAGMSRVGTAFQSASRFIQGFAGALSVGAVIEFSRASVAAVGGLADLAAQLGISAEALQVYRFAANTGGASAEQLETALIRLGDTIGNAARGNAEAIASFDRLGVRILDVAGNIRPTEAILEDIARALAATEDPARRVAAANDLFGRSGARLIPMLSDLAGGYDQLRGAAERAGQVVSADIVERTKRLADAWAATQTSLRNIAATVATPAFEAFARVMEHAARGAEVVRLLLNGGSISELQQLSERVAGLRENIRQEQTILDGLTNRPQAERDDLRQWIEFRRSRVENFQRELAAAQARLNELRPPAAPGDSNPPASGNPPRGSGAAARATEADRFGESLERLQRQIDPVYRLEREYAEQRQILDEAFNSGAFTVERYGERVSQLNARYDEARKSALGVADGAARATDRTGELIQAFEGFGRSSAKTIADMVVGLDQANFSIGRLIQTLASGILEKLIYERITGPLTRAAGGFFDSLLGNAFSFLGGGKSAAFAGVPAGVTSVAVGHSGGVGREIGRSRVVDAMAFAGAPRFHSGKAPWGAGEMPAIIRPEESVLTPGQMRALGPRGDVVVNVIDQRGAGAPPVETRSSTGPNGERTIDLFIGERVNRNADNGGLDKAMQRNFGVARTPTRRS